MKLIAPFYVHPLESPSDWTSLVDGDLSCDFAIVNVDSGPGETLDPIYEKALANGSRTPLLGYIPLGYGRRPPDDVIHDGLLWRDRYDVTDLFLDEAPADPREGCDTVDLIAQLRRNGATYIVTNPGTCPSPSLVVASDITCVVETDWQAYPRAASSSAAELDGCAPNQLMHIVHGVPPRAYDQTVTMAKDLGASYLWVTDATLPNPWGRLPADYAEVRRLVDESKN